MDFTETFHQEDTITLTLEEKREADQLLRDEQLRRADPAAYELQVNKRKINQERAIAAQVSSIRAQNAQPPLLPTQDPHEAFLAFQNSRIFDVHGNNHNNALQSNIGDPMIGIETTSIVPTQDPIPKSPLSVHLETAGLPPIQAANTRMQFRATQSPEEREVATDQNAKVQESTPALATRLSETSRSFVPYPQLQNLLDREAAKMGRQASL